MLRHGRSAARRRYCDRRKSGYGRERRNGRPTDTRSFCSALFYDYWSCRRSGWFLRRDRIACSGRLESRWGDRHRWIARRRSTWRIETGRPCLYLNSRSGRRLWIGCLAKRRRGGRIGLHFNRTRRWISEFDRRGGGRRITRLGRCGRRGGRLHCDWPSGREGKRRDGWGCGWITGGGFRTDWHYSRSDDVRFSVGLERFFR